MVLATVAFYATLSYNLFILFCFFFPNDKKRRVKVIDQLNRITPMSQVNLAKIGNEWSPSHSLCILKSIFGCFNNNSTNFWWPFEQQRSNGVCLYLSVALTSASCSINNWAIYKTKCKRISVSIVLSTTKIYLIVILRTCIM